MDIVIRNETESDVKTIFEVTKAAFDTLAISNHTEQFIIDALRDANVLSVSLVAVFGNRVVGHIAFSPVTISDGSPGWYGLGPISVLPELQTQGIGKSLMREGLARLRSIGAKGCILVGDPGYYERFGFRSPKDLEIEEVPQQFVLALPLEDSCASGNVVFHEAFAATG
jgi:putative acetyltransferase